jgi:hypothetical protein
MSLFSGSTAGNNSNTSAWMDERVRWPRRQHVLVGQPDALAARADESIAQSSSFERDCCKLQAMVAQAAKQRPFVGFVALPPTANVWPAHNVKT